MRQRRRRSVVLLIFLWRGQGKKVPFVRWFPVDDGWPRDKVGGWLSARGGQHRGEPIFAGHLKNGEGGASGALTHVTA